MKNRVELIGRCAEPETIIKDDFIVTKFGFATSEKYKNKSGEKVDETTWHNVVMYGKLAEIAEKYVKKGDLLDLSGKIKYRSYESEGIKKYITEIIAKDMIMLGVKKQTSQDHASTQQNVSSDQPSKENQTDFVDQEDDLPF